MSRLALGRVSILDVIAVARLNPTVALGDGAVAALEKARVAVEEQAGASAGAKAERVLTNDPGMRIIRHVDAGYDTADAIATERGVRVPMRED